MCHSWGDGEPSDAIDTCKASNFNRVKSLRQFKAFIFSIKIIFAAISKKMSLSIRKIPVFLCFCIFIFFVLKSTTLYYLTFFLNYWFFNNFKVQSMAFKTNPGGHTLPPMAYDHQRPSGKVHRPVLVSKVQHCTLNFQNENLIVTVSQD